MQIFYRDELVVLADCEAESIELVLGCSDIDFASRDLLDQSDGVSRGIKGAGNASSESINKHRSFSGVSTITAVDGLPLPPSG